jgi:error-prone DNA polymerase
MLPRLRPAEFYDLVIQVTIVRPGPIGEDGAPYLQRREVSRDAAGRIGARGGAWRRTGEGITHKTLGTRYSGEQACDRGGEVSPDEANGLRRAMATFKRAGRSSFETSSSGHDPARLRSGLCGKLQPDPRLRRIQFPESHAANFANLVYVSCWMKCYYDMFAAHS